MGYSRAVHGWRLTGVAAIALVAAAAAWASPARTASATCHVLSPGSLPLGRLEASYRKLTMLPANTPLTPTGPRRYGACGGTHYAFELLTPARGVHLTYREQVAQQDHSPVWKQPASGAWVDEGLDALCNLAPHALLNAWHVGARCG